MAKTRHVEEDAETVQQDPHTEAVTEQPLRAAQELGSFAVETALHKLDPSIESYTFDVTPIVGPHAVVSRSFEKVYKGSDGYPIGKSQVFISYPCYREEIPKVLEAISAFAQNALRNESQKVRQKESDANESSIPGTRRKL